MRIKRIIFGSGCLISVLGPIVALVLYPRANVLFAFILVGVVVLVIARITSKDPTPQEIADDAEGLLNGWHHGYDVDDYEHLNPRNPHLRDLWQRTMYVGGGPEAWGNLDEETKTGMRDIISQMRQLGDPHN
jgi:hypothetical protein